MFWLHSVCCTVFQAIVLHSADLNLFFRIFVSMKDRDRKKNQGFYTDKLSFGVFFHLITIFTWTNTQFPNAFTLYSFDVYYFFTQTNTHTHAMWREKYCFCLLLYLSHKDRRCNLRLNEIIIPFVTISTKCLTTITPRSA